MKTTRTLWRTIGVSAIIALIGFGMASCDNNNAPPVSHTITFNTHGGSTVPDQTVEEGQTATRPAQDPTRQDYTFTGWFTAPTGGAAFDFTAPITGPTTVHARWTAQIADYYTVIFDAVEGSPTPGNQTVAGGDFATMPTPAPTRTGYTLDGWFAPGATAAFAFAITPITANITLTAQWTAVAAGNFTVSFDAAEGSPTPGNQTVAEGDFATMPTPAPTRTGYTFDGWFVPSATTAFDFATTPITANITLTAQWTAVAAGNFTVSFDAAGGSPTPGNQTVAEGDFVTVPTPAPTRTGYTLDGWFAPGAIAAFAFATTPITANITLTAQWTAVAAEQHTVTFDVAGGSPEPEPQTITTGDFAILPNPEPTRARHTFDGWFALGAATAFAFATTPVTADITLTARWTASPPSPMNWTAIPAGTGEGASTFTGDEIISAVAYGSGRWVAVGGRIAHSEDGITWTAASVDGGFSRVAYGNGRWIVAGGQGRMAHSEDGITWTVILAGDEGSTFPGNASISAVAYGNGRWVAAGGSGRMAHSEDGITWAAIPGGTGEGASTFPAIGTFFITGVAYGNGRWVAVGNMGRMAHSEDGITWTAIPAGDWGGSTFPVNSTIYGVTYANGIWLAFGGGNRMARSMNGINWTAISDRVFPGATNPSAQWITGMAYGSGRWVGVGSASRMAHSTDSINWTGIPHGTGEGTNTFPFRAWPTPIFGVAYGNGTWVAVGTHGRMAFALED